MDPRELARFVRNWCGIQRNATKSEQAQFVAFYCEHYPEGAKELSFVWDYQNWRDEHADLISRDGWESDSEQERRTR